MHLKFMWCAVEHLHIRYMQESDNLHNHLPITGLRRHREIWWVGGWCVLKSKCSTKIQLKMLLRVINAAFDDKRIMVGAIWCWLVVVLAVFTEMVRIQH
jgi:hypothetical protein